MKKSKKIKSSKFFFKIAWLVFICLVSALLARFAISGLNDMLAFGKEPDIVQIELSTDCGIDEVANILESKKVISEKWCFKIYALVTKAPKKFNQGVYEVEVGMDYQAIINRMKDAESSKDVVEVTITEGMNVMECANLMSKSGICNKDEFLKCCSSDKFDEKYSFLKEISNNGKRIYKLEGYLFPDTYKFYRDEKPYNVVIKFLNNYQKKIYQKIDVEGYSSKISISEIAANQNIPVDEVINIASLIQAEAANKEDMYNVSSVINNRLATAKTEGKNRFGEFSMNILRLDATVYYPYKSESAVPSKLRKNFSSSYNTYKIEGLPPGPICNPGIEAIKAALFPAKTDYYYYCHSASGQSFFAKTNDVHIANLKKAGIA